ncbi:S8 family serine peptidase [Actinomadura sp. ATCC 31491]|uniref:S8 family serine peptidase n=1 Tax=Actinomadura luzonensis TaxID=2805427 RepID=A0ABT0G9P6_9ACTN|nr:S8 family serine peptidase [Actinomadura luzonensis]MCK2221307.1 S8 family serine peptidase [Actinomadura luzonensis]
MIGRAVLASLLALNLAAAPAAAAAPEECNPKKGTLKLPAGEPWAQKRLDIKAAWQLTRGAGVTVAVVDSGADYHPQVQLSKIIDETHTGYRDCVGHGTAVSGIIGARYLSGVPFHGVAPDARIVMVKQSNKTEGDINTLVNAINDAVDAKADVINVSVRASDNASLKAAVQRALDNDIVVVAAAGNVTGPDDQDVPAYPAAYEGVLAVGAATPDGKRADSSNAVTPVGVLGPGTDITAPWPGRSYMRGLQGTSFASPYVAGTAALVRARFPKLNQEQVRRRIIATADGTSGAGTGAGMVNPLLALTAVLPYEAANGPVVAEPPPSALPANAVAKVPARDEKAMGVAMAVGTGALMVVLVAGALVLLIPLGRRRGWRPGRASSS